MSDVRPLPVPYGDELVAALKRRGYGSQTHQHIYAFLYSRRVNPPTQIEISDYLGSLVDAKYSQLQRRRRQLAEVFCIEHVSGHRYKIVDWQLEEKPASGNMNRRVRFEVLQSGRCNRCGHTVEDDGVKLVVDHVIPRRWGGSDDISNLQPLCEECNGGKKDYYGTFDQYSDEIREAVNYDEPHRRIAAILLAFKGRAAPAELIGAVASAKQYQEDWQKRLRELRYFGWEIRATRSTTGGARVRVSYRASVTTTLPGSDLSVAVRRIERQRARAKRVASQSNADPRLVVGPASGAVGAHVL